MTNGKAWTRKGTRRQILTRGTDAKDRRATAAHEAAHGVVAHRLGGQILEIRITAPRLGFTTYELRKRRGRPVCPITTAVVALAGHEAEHRFYGRPLKLPPAHDFNTVLKLGCSDKSANLIGWTTRQYVRWWSRDIRRIQRALLKRGSLNRRQFLAALRAA